jgi:hypothetical protein
MSKFIFGISINLILFLSFVTTSYPQKPEKVYSIVKQIKTFEWYISEAEQWGAIVRKGKADPEAWLNYYTACRMAKNMFPDKWQTAKGEYLVDLDKIVKKADESIPNTFENYYLKVRNNHAFNDQQIKDMFKAYELGPDRPEIFDELVTYYEIQRDTVNEGKICRKWFDSRDISPGILNWNYNVLASLDPNSILLTNGDNDTYPIWVLQYVQGFRKDIIVLNINLIMIERYRDKLFSEKNIKSFKPDTSIKDGFSIMKGILQHLVKNSNGMNVYFSFTLNPVLYEDIKDKTYMTGLAFKYSEKDFDNMAYLIRNYENNWLLDYLKADFTNDLSVSVINQINTNYLPVFAKLYNHFNLSGKEESMDYVKNLAKLVAQKSENMEYYKYLFEQ